METDKGFVSIYGRGKGAISDLWAKKDINGKDFLAAPYSNVLYVFDEEKV